MGTTLEIRRLSIEISEKGEVRIINLLSDQGENIKSNPHDGLLDVYIKTRKNDQTYFNVKKLKINNPENKLVIDGVVELNTPTTVGIVKEILGVIVGRERTFE